MRSGFTTIVPVEGGDHSIKAHDAQRQAERSTTDVVRVNLSDLRALLDYVEYCDSVGVQGFECPDDEITRLYWVVGAAARKGRLVEA